MLAPYVAMLVQDWGLSVLWDPLVSDPRSSASY